MDVLTPVGKVVSAPLLPTRQLKNLLQINSLRFLAQCVLFLRSSYSQLATRPPEEHMSIKLLSRLLSASALVGLMTVASSASALNITPAGPGLVCTTNETSVPKVEEACLSGLTEVYKQDVNGPESGSLAGSYTTTFFNTPSDPADATIVYNGGSFIDCTLPETCYLLVKDGNSIPAAYVFNLTGIWDGKETLNLTGFWPGTGAISHVSLYGGVTTTSSTSSSTTTGGQTPEPGTSALALLGLGMIGLALRSRRRKAN